MATAPTASTSSDPTRLHVDAGGHRHLSLPHLLITPASHTGDHGNDPWLDPSRRHTAGGGGSASSLSVTTASSDDLQSYNDDTSVFSSEGSGGTPRDKRSVASDGGSVTPRRERANTFSGAATLSATTPRRSSSKNLCGSFESLLHRLSPKRGSHGGGGGGPGGSLGDLSRNRSVRVEFAGSGSSRRSSFGSPNAEDWDENLDLPDHNFTSHLLITGLQEGVFRSEIDLQSIPKDDVTIRVHGYKLEVIVLRKRRRRGSSTGKRGTVSVPCHIGLIHLPMFVDTASLRFAYDSDRDVLVLEGTPKGALGCARSVSLGSLTSGGLLFKPPDRGPSSSGGGGRLGSSWRALRRKISVSNENILQFWKAKSLVKQSDR